MERTPIESSLNLPQNPELIYSNQGPTRQQKLIVADYLWLPVLQKFDFEFTIVRSIVIRIAATMLHQVAKPDRIQNLAYQIQNSQASKKFSTNTKLPVLTKYGIEGEIQSTVSQVWQEAIQRIVHSELQILKSQGAYQAGVIVLENRFDHFELKAMVSTGTTQRINSTLIVRQAGSVLKPFIYGIGFDKFGLLPKDQIDDTSLRIINQNQVYEPRNHDNQFTGRISIREALASSRNIPAVRMVQLIGTASYVEFLKKAGLNHLGSAEEYGQSVALGTGEASTLQTAILFSILCANGKQLPVLFGHAIDSGESIYLDSEGRLKSNPPKQEIFFTENTAMLLTHILSDQQARRISFGQRNFLDFPFDVAAKTGTSQSFKDSWTAGYTDRYTVAVWIGNFSGASMDSVSGLRGAARIFHQVIRLIVDQDRPRFRYPNSWVFDAVRQSNGGLVEEVTLPRSGVAEPIAKLLLDNKEQELILSPKPNQVFYLNPHRSLENDKIPIVFSSSEHRFSITKQNQPVTSFQNRRTQKGSLYVSLDRGRYSIQLFDKNNRLVQELQFEIR